MASRNVSCVVRGAGLLTTIFAGLSDTMRKIVGEGNEELVEEKIHHLSTLKGQFTLDMIAEVALGNGSVVRLLRPGMSVLWLDDTVFFGDGTGKRFPFSNGEDKAFLPFIKTVYDFLQFVLFLSMLSGLKFEYDREMILAENGKWKECKFIAR